MRTLPKNSSVVSPDRSYTVGGCGGGCGASVWAAATLAAPRAGPLVEVSRLKVIHGFDGAGGGGGALDAAAAVELATSETEMIADSNA